MDFPIPTTWILGLLALFLVLYLSIRVRKYIEYLRETGLKGLGATLFIPGLILYALQLLKVQLPSGIAKLLPPNTAFYMMVGGASLIILNWILNRFKKKELLNLEEERREYITRVRKGINLEQAEKIALDYVKNRIHRGDIQILANNKEFKLWTIFIKDGTGRKYKVALDIEGEIQAFETVDQLPSYMTGPY